MFGLSALLIAIGISMLTGAIPAAWVTHKYDKAEYNQLKADLHKAEADGLKQAAALAAKYEERRQAEAASWDQQRQALIQQSRAANRKVEKYVKERPGAC